VLGAITKVTAADGKAGDRLGDALHIFGDLAAVGAPKKGAGAVYVYARSGTTWTLNQKVTASDGASGDSFGVAVALHRGALAVGASADDDAGSDSGSAYLFSRSGATWSQQQKITGSDSAAGDSFGGAVALGDSSVIIGARADDDRGLGSGTAFVFSRSGTTWSQQQKITGADGAAGDSFGGAVALGTGYALVGAPSDDDRGTDSGSAYLFSRSGTTWTQQQKVTAPKGKAQDNLGDDVALDGGYALLGAPGDDDRGSSAGAAYVYSRSGTTWSQQRKLTSTSGKAQDQLGKRVALSGRVAILGAPGDDEKATGAGAAHVYSRDGTTWSKRYKLFASTFGASDALGSAVGLSGDVALLGSPGDDDRGSDAGAAYFRQLCLGQGFNRSSKATMPGGTSLDQFGNAAAVHGTWALVTAPGDDDLGTDTGSAFFYQRSGTSWSMRQKVLGPGSGTYDGFGNAAAIDGNRAVVGAQYHTPTGGMDRAGAAYVFSRSGNVWIGGVRLTASDRASHDNLGRSVATAASLVLAGVPRDDDRGTDSGSVRVFSGSGTSWTQSARLTAFDGNSSDNFGQSVAADASGGLVGAPGDDDLGTSSGSAYLYTRSGTTWSILSKLLASDGTSGDQFGSSVALDGDLALVGAPGDDDRASDAGSAYLFARNGTIWSQQKKLTALDANMDAGFGQGTALSGTTAVVAASGDMDRGAIYIFTRSGTTWRQLQKLTGQGLSSGDDFGRGVDIGTDAVVAGLPFDDDRGTDSGSVFFYGLTCGNPVGTPCLLSASCATGLCQDQVCCDGPCGGTGDCMACARHAGALEDGTCGLAKPGAICRAAVGLCDQPDTCNGVTKACPADLVKAPGTTCRAAAGACDRAEQCNGSSTVCPADTYMSSSFVCRNAAGSCDAEEKCTGTSAACPADTVAKSGAICRQATSDCDAAETCDGKTTACPADKVKGATAVCRKAISACDVAETCDGKTTTCPSDKRAAKGVVCRKPAGTCDLPETCDGSSMHCPADEVKASATSCRSPAGTCDLPEVCDGVKAKCPKDELRLNTYICRAATGACDVPEFCSGLTVTCPADAVEKKGTVCRLGFGLCDKSETCDGKSLTCPKDSLEPAGTVCRKAKGGCDAAETCDGKSLTCPVDQIKAKGAVCRKSISGCDPAEICDGATTACPSDALAKSGTVCRSAAGLCDKAEQCNGISSICPSDVLAKSGDVCRKATGKCDLAETCDGKIATCPTDKLASSGAVCRAAAGLCDAAETCDGATGSCPADLLMSSGSTCRAAVGKCDTAEICDGAKATCPTDMFKALGLTCRAPIDECDFTEKCSGAAGKCPSDTYKPNGTSCLSGAGTCQTGRCITDAGVLDGGADGDMGGSDAGDLGATDAEAGAADADLASLDADGTVSDGDTSDGVASDGVVSGDSGGEGEGEGDEEGCSCRAGANGAQGWPMALVVLLLLFRRPRQAR